jgi:hypothetical protein
MYGQQNIKFMEKCVVKMQTLACTITTLFYNVDVLWYFHPVLCRRHRATCCPDTVHSVALSVVTAFDRLTECSKGFYWIWNWPLALRRHKSKETSFVLLLAHSVGQRHTTTLCLVLPSLRDCHGPLSPNDFDSSRVQIVLDSGVMSYYISLCTVRRSLLLIGENEIQKHLENNFWKMSGHKLWVTGSSEESGRRGTWGILLLKNMAPRQKVAVDPC